MAEMSNPTECCEFVLMPGQKNKGLLIRLFLWLRVPGLDSLLSLYNQKFPPFAD
jgi:hypothetical protein